MSPHLLLLLTLRLWGVSISYVRGTLHMPNTYNTFSILWTHEHCTCQTQLDVFSHILSCLNHYFRKCWLNESMLGAHGTIGAWWNKNSIYEWPLDWSILSCSRPRTKNLHIKKVSNVLDICKIILTICEFHRLWQFCK